MQFKISKGFIADQVGARVFASQNATLYYPLAGAVGMPAFGVFTIEQADRCTPNHWFIALQQRGPYASPVVGFTIGIHHSSFDDVAVYFKFKIHVAGAFFPLRRNRETEFTTIHHHLRNGPGAAKGVSKTPDKRMCARFLH